MANDLETTIRTALEKLAKALADASEVTVETRYKPIDPQNPNSLDNSFLAARTVIQLDGDQEMVIPVTVSETQGVNIEDSLLELHMRNVQAAIDYRNGAMGTMLNAIRKRSL